MPRMVDRRGGAPATIVLTTFLLLVGGVVTVMSGLLGDTMGSVFPAWALVPYGLVYLLLASAVLRGRAWGRVVLLALCGVGVGLALARVVYDSPAQGVSQLAWPVIYAVLLNLPSARAWFRRPPPGDDPFYDPLTGPDAEP